MSNSKEVFTYLNKSQADGDVVYDIPAFTAPSPYKISFNVDNVTAGSLEVYVKYMAEASYETLLDANGNPRTVDLTSPLTFIADEWVSVKFVPVGVVGTYSIFGYKHH
ncbi:hypothetical protein [Vibrio phage JSF13]|nr:hypothetical protein [Vibrio phage JSF13]QVV99981.1 hypothetical protein 2017DhaAA_0530 [Vibrio phage ICP1]